MLVTIQIQDDLLSTLLTHAQDAGSSVESFIEETLREALSQPVAENTVVEGLLLAAIEGVAQIKSKAEFSLDDVIDAGDWDLMTGGERKSLGRRFRKEAEGSGVAKWLRRNSGNKAIYQKLQLCPLDAEKFSGI